ncbi:type 11 methyltransferase [Rhizobium sp. CCGE 510]|nr:type 11 methyltransferase [Rhizobium sp. CCGE 510]
MSSITEGNAVQYGDSRKLAARARLHTEYTIAEMGWFPWVAAQLPLKPGDRVLDVGCGPAWFWAATAGLLPEDLTLADRSSGMIDEAVARGSRFRFRQAIADAFRQDNGALDVSKETGLFLSRKPA